MRNMWGPTLRYVTRVANDAVRYAQRGVELQSEELATACMERKGILLLILVP